VKRKNLLRLARLMRRTRPAWADQRGVAAIEFALFAMFLSMAIINVADVSIYIYQRMQAENATEVGAQAAWKACDLNHLPASTKCPGLATAVQTAVHSTSLGSSVSLQTGSPSEGYYCVNAANALQYISDTSTKPANCTAAGTPSLQPADYIKVQTTFPYAPLFPGMTVTGFFPTPITKTALMRLG
jgi:Flp pilus assembly protein TadG